jgi:hypothetical protein
MNHVILNASTSHPTRRSYVLKLHRDASPERGLLFGRLENMATGRRFDFRSAAELLGCLARDADLTDSTENKQ